MKTIESVDDVRIWELEMEKLLAFQKWKRWGERMV